MPSLTLSIEAQTGADGWRGTWTLDGVAVAAPIVVSRAAASELAAMSRRFLDLFEPDAASREARRPVVDAGDLRAIGRALFERWIAPAWPSIESRLGVGPHTLLVQTRDPTALNLPWELIELTPGLPLGCDAGWWLRRTPLSVFATGGPPLEAGPLRILFVAAAPTDQPQLDYEAEEDALLGIAGRVGGDVAIVLAETGTFDELGELVSRFRPQIVHLSGHGKSTLATCAANQLAAAGFTVVPIRAAAGAGPAECGRATVSKIIAALDDAFIAARRMDLHGTLTDGNLSIEQRLRLAVVEGLNALRLAIVLDNFEDCLELETRRIADPDLERFYEHAPMRLTRGSRLIVTCRYLPAGTPLALPTVVTGDQAGDREPGRRSRHMATTRNDRRHRRGTTGRHGRGSNRHCGCGKRSKTSRARPRPSFSSGLSLIGWNVLKPQLASSR